MSSTASPTVIGGTSYYYQSSGAADDIVQKSGGALQFTVHPGDVWSHDPSTVNRSEIASAQQIANGTAVHVAYQMAIQSGAVDPNPSSWAVLGQLHQNDGPNTPHNSPPFSIQVDNGKMQIAIGYTDPVSKDTSRVIWSDPKNIVQGATYAMDIKATFNPNGSGHLTVSRNGVVLVEYNGPLGYVSQSSVYWKEGIYRGASNTTMTASYSNLTVATASSSSARLMAASTSQSANLGGFRLLSKASTYDAGTGHVTGGVMRYVSTDGKQTLEKRFNASGTLINQQQLGLDGSRSNMTYGSNGALQQSIAVHADGSSDSAQYGITNKSYVSILTHTDNKGVITWQQEGFSNGTKVVCELGNSTQSYKTKTTSFNAAGVKTSVTYANLDGTTGVYSYVATGAMTQAMVTAKDGTQTTTNYTSAGVIQTSKTAYPDGSKIYTNYNAAGVKTNKFFSYVNGSTETDVFSSKGTLTQKLLTATNGSQTTTIYTDSGIIQQSKVINKDGSKSYTSYDASGHKTNTYFVYANGSSETDIFATNGVLTQKIIRAKDGSQTTDTYNGNGSLEEMKLIHPDGSRLYIDYNVGGYASVMTQSNAAGATTATQQVQTNGNSTGKAFAAGVTLVSQSGSDTFTSYHNDTFVFHSGFGQDTIYGFNGAGSLHDVLQIDKSVVADYAHLHKAQSGANTVITVSSQESITLKGVNLSALSASNFSFV